MKPICPTDHGLRLALVIVCLASTALQTSNALDSPEPGIRSGGQEVEEIDAALTRFRKGDSGGALSLLRAAVKKHPELPPAPVIMAQFYAAAGQARGLRVSLEQAVVEVPTDPEAYVILADLALQEQRIAEAHLLYDKAVRLAAAFEGNTQRKQLLQQRAYRGLAAVAESRKDWPTAEQHLESLLDVNPANASAIEALGRVLFEQGSAAQALERFREAARLNQNVLTPEAILAQLYERAGDRENAARYIREALSANPRDLQTHLAAARWGLETLQLDFALEQVDAAIEIDAAATEARLLRGTIALFSKDYATAEKELEWVLLRSPSNFAASNNLAVALCEQDDADKRRRALEYAQANWRQHRNQAAAAATLGWTLYNLGRIDEAERVLQGAAGAGTISPDTAYYLARLSVKRGRNTEARQLLAKALEARQPFLHREEANALLTQLNE